jgi:hypothetical protein
MKIRPVGAEFIHVDEQRDGQMNTHTWTNLIVSSRNFWNAPKN